MLAMACQALYLGEIALEAYVHVSKCEEGSEGAAEGREGLQRVGYAPPHS